jgi:hypothetical protein
VTCRSDGSCGIVVSISRTTNRNQGQYYADDCSKAQYCRYYRKQDIVEDWGMKVVGV